MSSEDKKVQYILYVDGDAKLVSKEAWEADWLRWYKEKVEPREL